MKVDTILGGNCIEILKTIPDNSIDLIFADPPYWMRTEGVLHRVEGTEFDGCDDDWDNQFRTQDDYEQFTEQWLRECKRVLKKNGSIWVIGSMQCIYAIGGIMQKLGFWFINDVVWHKKNPTPNFKGTRLNNSHETLLWATTSESAKYTFNYWTAKELNTDTVDSDDHENGVRKQLGSVWRIAVCQGVERLKDDRGEKLHNTQKPEELLYRIISISSKVGDIVLDPFGGTMTTGAVAKRTGRRYIMIERDSRYCQYGEKRIANTEVSIGDIEKAIFDAKPPRVSLKEMIDAEYLFVNEPFYLKSRMPVAVLTADAKLEFQNEVLDIHACAARAIGRKSGRVNGFNYWYVLRNGELVSIDRIRAQYRAEVLNFTMPEAGASDADDEDADTALRLLQSIIE